MTFFILSILTHNNKLYFPSAKYLQEHCISDYIKLIVQSYVVHANILN